MKALFTLSAILAITLATLAFEAPPTHAQGMSQGGGGGMGGGRGGGRRGRGNAKADQQKKKPDTKAAEQAYKSAIDSLPDKKFDPWKGVHDTPDH